MAKQYKRKKAVAKSTKKDDNQTVQAQIGLKGFVKRGKQFSANLKQCHSDFQVAWSGNLISIIIICLLLMQ